MHTQITSAQCPVDWKVKPSYEFQKKKQTNKQKQHKNDAKLYEIIALYLYHTLIQTQWMCVQTPAANIVESCSNFISTFIVSIIMYICIQSHSSYDFLWLMFAWFGWVFFFPFC